MANTMGKFVTTALGALMGAGSGDRVNSIFKGIRDKANGNENNQNGNNGLNKNTSALIGALGGALAGHLTGKVMFGNSTPSPQQTQNSGSLLGGFGGFIKKSLMLGALGFGGACIYNAMQEKQENNTKL